ncbi:hypothetical protein ABIB94_005560 [Bradyrhizobium sp. JR7.2]|uniref:hypothetical protein n=1 Tax=Bradyrhizobium sp. JR7.2 TaxID=3156375 RepID=UPI0033913488
MTGQPSLYNLFDQTDVQYWELQIEKGNLPTPEQLALLIKKNSDQPLPAWLTALVIRGLRGELKGKRGRPHRSSYHQLCVWAAAAEYKCVLAQMLQAEDAEHNGGAAKTGKGRTHKPAHERAAEQVVTEWRLPMSWRSFLNEVRSKK